MGRIWLGILMVLAIDAFVLAVVLAMALMATGLPRGPARRQARRFAVAEELEHGGDALESFSRRSEAQGLRAWSRAEVVPPASSGSTAPPPPSSSFSTTTTRGFLRTCNSLERRLLLPRHPVTGIRTSRQPWEGDAMSAAVLYMSMSLDGFIADR